ncbi:MAG: FkbM family methyltransferase [Roseovarius sp.]|jgi:FkbM family methyltransferase|nr:FkbM family methyltransferase [Roseovarius sp.]
MGPRAQNLAHRIVRRAAREFHARFPQPEDERMARWHALGGEKRRLDYDLDPASVVFDLGGYNGLWTSEIYARFRCRVHVFEAAPSFATALGKRFEHNPDITVYDFGLASEDGLIRLGVSEDATSAFRVSDRQEVGNLRCAREVLAELGDPTIDLMKINIEGGEYDLIEHLVESGDISRIKDLQVQFHDFVPDAQSRMQRIQSSLTATHDLTWQVEFVHENWRLR